MSAVLRDTAPFMFLISKYMAFSQLTNAVPYPLLKRKCGYSECIPPTRFTSEFKQASEPLKISICPSEISEAANEVRDAAKKFGAVSIKVGDAATKFRGFSVSTSDTATQVRDTATKFGDVSFKVGDAATNFGDCLVKMNEAATQVQDVATKLGDASIKISDSATKFGDIVVESTETATQVRDAVMKIGDESIKISNAATKLSSDFGIIADSWRKTMPFIQSLILLFVCKSLVPPILSTQVFFAGWMLRVIPPFLPFIIDFFYFNVKDMLLFECF
jgi:hypothetical protein